jgi:hypothetical protein
MTTSETGQQPTLTIGVGEVQARRTHPRTIAVMFIASLGLMIGASLGLGFLLGRASIWSAPSGAAPTGVAGQSQAAGAPKTEPQTKDSIPPSKVNEGTLAATVDRPGNTPASQALPPNVGAKKSGAESRDIAKSQVLAADSALLVGAIQQPVTLEAKERTPVTILNPASDPTVDAPSRNAQHWLKLAEEVRHQAEEPTRAAGKRLLLKIADTYERLAQLATEETADEKPRRRHRSRR